MSRSYRKNPVNLSEREFFPSEGPPEIEKDRNRLRALLDTSPAGVVIVEKSDGKISFVNDQAFKLFGKELFTTSPAERPEKLGLYKTDGSLYKSDETPSARSMHGEVISGEEMVILREDGKEIFISVNTSPLLDSSGNVEAVISVFNDISAKKTADKQIQYQAFLINNLLDAVIAEDKNYFITFWNPGAEELYGWDAEEIMGKNVVDYLATTFDDGMSRDEIFRIIDREGIYEGDITQKNKAGETLHIHSRFRSIKDKHGEITEYIVVNRDITDRKLVEQALRESEESYSKMFRNSPVAIVTTTIPDMKIQMVNDAFLKLFGFTEEEVLGKDSRELDMARDEDMPEIMRLFAENGFVRDFEAKRHTKDGKDLILLINLDKIILREKTYLMANIVDITERRTMEREIREKANENARLAKIIELSTTAIAFSDMEGRMLYVNNAMEEITGYSMAELNQLDWSANLTSPEYREIELTVRDQILETGEPLRYEKEYIRKDGSRVMVEILLNLMREDDGTPKFWFAFINDITEHKKYETNLFVLIRTLKAMQKSSQLIAHVEDEHEYLQKVCNIIVEDCGHQMVWIGYKLDDDQKTVLPVACAGTGTKYIESLKIRWDDSEFGRGPVGTAIKKGIPVVTRDIRSDPDFVPWKKKAVKTGFASVIALPLYLNDVVFGSMNIYSNEIYSFSEEEEQLLMKLADDLSYGLTSIRLKQDLQKAKNELETKVEQRTALLRKTMHDLEQERQRLNDVLNIIPAYVVVLTKDYEIRFCNMIFRNDFGEYSNKKFFQNRIDDCRECDVVEIIESEKNYHWEWAAPNGRFYDVYDYSFPDNDGTELILEMGIDITEKKNFDKLLISKILETEEKDRRIFASDLHDDLGPTLSAIKLQLSFLLNEINDEPQKELLRVCDVLLSEGIEKMRFVANSIMPSLIESFGLETAVNSFINRISKNSGLKFDVKTVNLKGHRFSAETELHLYRIITELITNTIKHSGASSVSLKMEINDGIFTIIYQDDGMGYQFQANQMTSKGIGLQNIKNRVRLIDGDFSFREKDGKTVFYLTKKI